MLSVVARSPSPRDDDFEYAVLRALASGRPDDALRLLEDADPTTGFSRLASADARMRSLEITVPEMQALREEIIGNVEHAPLRYWSDAVLCERLLLQGDPTAFSLAAESLADIDDELLPPFLTLYARARLRRTAAMPWFLVPLTDLRDDHRRRRDAAIQDLQRCGFGEEAAFTRGLFAAARALLNGDDLVEGYGVVLDALRIVDDGQPTMYAQVLRCALAVIAFENGDHEAALTTSGTALETLSPRSPFHLIHRYLQASAELLADPTAPSEPVEDLLREHASHAAHHVAVAYAHFAGVLADLGHPATPRVARLALDQVVPVPTWYVDHQVLRIRADLADGEDRTAADVLAPLEELCRIGRNRQAATAGLRLAVDLARAGAPEQGRELFDWALPRLPGDLRRSWGERRLVERANTALDGPAAVAGGDAPDAGTATAATLIRVLSPILDVSVDGHTVVLGEAPAKLLLTLAIAHPRPLHVEAVTSVLWPEDDYDTCRRRLNTLVHRLRRAVGDVPLVVRRDDVLLLDDDRCVVDLHEFRQAMTADEPVRRQALAGVRSALCAAQFPYDDAFVEERHRFTAIWLDHARALVEAGAPVAEFAGALDALGVDREDLTGA